MHKYIRGLMVALTAAAAVVLGAGTGFAETSLTVGNVNLNWADLGPPPNPAGAAFNEQYMNSIYGELFQLDPGGKVIPDLATSYKVSDDGLTFTITIRDGVKFQDGTDFTADAVLQQWQAALDPKNSCGCLGSFTAVKSVEAQGKDVIMHLSRPDATIMVSLIGQQLNWVPSPTALKSMGAQAFGLKPIGAGPYEVVSNNPGTQLVLKRFDGYWKKGQPYIDNLTFLNLHDDQSAYAALAAGNVQLVLGMTQAQLLARAGQDYKLSVTPGVVPYQLLFNTTKAPFNDLKARQALAYATNPAVLLQAAAPGLGVLTESEAGPGGLFYAPKVDGTVRYDLDKAKAAVKDLGGLSFQLNYPTNTSMYLTAGQAAVSMWAQAGIKVTLNPTDPATSGVNNRSGNWQIQFTTVGGYDPSAGATGFSNRYGSQGSLSPRAPVPDFDKMAGVAASELDPKKRADDITGIYQYIANNVWSLNLFAVPCVAVAVKNLTGLDAVAISTAGKEMIHWENVKFTN